MGAYLSYYFKFWKSVSDEPDLDTGLTSRDLTNIRKSWALTSKDPVGTGCEILIRFFTAYPESRKFFLTFRDLNHEELRRTAQFQAHCLSIVTWFSNIVSNLDKPDLLVAMAEKLGQNHGRRKVQLQNFLDIRKVILQTLIDVLHIDLDTQQSWEKTLTFIYKHIQKNLDHSSGMTDMRIDG